MDDRDRREQIDRARGRDEEDRDLFAIRRVEREGDEEVSALEERLRGFEHEVDAAERDEAEEARRERKPPF